VEMQSRSSPLASERLGYVSPLSLLLLRYFFSKCVLCFFPRRGCYFFAAILRMHTPVDTQLKVSGNFRSNSVRDI